MVLSQDSLRGPDRVITEQEVYQRLRAMPLHWNVSRLASIVLDPVTQHTLSGEEILHIWTSALAKYQTEHETERRDDGRDMASYIKTMYGIDPDAFRGWKMYPESVPGTKDLIEAVFVSLRDRPEDAQAYVPEMCEAITYCPDRQIATLSMLHGALHSTRDTSSFEYFVENEIAVLKNYIFEMVVTPGEGTQNVHVQNVWKERLKDTLGLNVTYQSRMGTFDQDVFGGHAGNALDAFYTKFTPGYVVGRLAEEINAKRLNDAGSFLHRRLGDREYAKRVFEFKSEEDTENLVPAQIRSAGVEDILVDMGILERGGDSVCMDVD